MGGRMGGRAAAPFCCMVDLMVLGAAALRSPVFGLGHTLGGLLGGVVVFFFLLRRGRWWMICRTVLCYARVCVPIPSRGPFGHTHLWGGIGPTECVTQQ